MWSWSVVGRTKCCPSPYDKHSNHRYFPSFSFLLLSRRHFILSFVEFPLIPLISPSRSRSPWAPISCPVAWVFCSKRLWRGRKAPRRRWSRTRDRIPQCTICISPWVIMTSAFDREYPFRTKSFASAWYSRRLNPLPVSLLPDLCRLWWKTGRELSNPKSRHYPRTRDTHWWPNDSQS